MSSGAFGKIAGAAGAREDLIAINDPAANAASRPVFRIVRRRLDSVITTDGDVSYYIGTVEVAREIYLDALATLAASR